MAATSGQHLEPNNGLRLRIQKLTKEAPLRRTSGLAARTSDGRLSATSGPNGWRRITETTVLQALIFLVLVISLQVACVSVNQNKNVESRVALTDEVADHHYRHSMKESRSQMANDVIAIKEGADLDLSCPIVVTNEDMIISWTCDDDPANIRSSRIHVTDTGKLRIHSAKVGDSCNYRCEAADGFGTLSVIIKVIIVDRQLMDQLTRRAGITNSTTIKGNDEEKHRRLLDDSKHSNQKQAASSNQIKTSTDDGLDIEMHIEPAEVHVSKNQTFLLECRIKHALHPTQPQIIWLKEYIGTHIDSLNDAIDNNLLLIDGAYYHSLNWPRQSSYSEKSLTSSSALLVKQSNYVHSGRYACFAGYPASLLNLHYNNKISNSSLTLGDMNSTMHRSLLRYKIVQAVVKVDDEVGYKSSVSYLATSENARTSNAPTNIFVNVISSNTWVRNLTLILLVFCVSLTMFKVIGRRRKFGTRKTRQPDTNLTASDCTTPNPLVDSQRPVSVILNPTEYLAEITVDRYDPSHVPANSLMNDSNPLCERYAIDQALLNERLNCIGSTDSGCNNDHVYSEIGYQIAGNAEEPYYKKPNPINK